MSKYTKIKEDEKSRAFKVGITDRILLEKTRKNKSRRLNPMKLVGRKALKRYKKLSWKDKTDVNKFLRLQGKVEAR